MPLVVSTLLILTLPVFPGLLIFAVLLIFSALVFVPLVAQLGVLRDLQLLGFFKSQLFSLSRLLNFSG
jgi:hypothetical protein